MSLAINYNLSWRFRLQKQIVLHHDVWRWENLDEGDYFGYNFNSSSSDWVTIILRLIHFEGLGLKCSNAVKCVAGVCISVLIICFLYLLSLNQIVN